MRYIKIDTISFTDSDGNEHAVKDIRPIPNYTIRLEVPIEKGMFIDEIISKKELEGDGTESLSYTVIDANKEKLTENDFNLPKLVNLKIPIPQEIV